MGDSPRSICGRVGSDDFVARTHLVAVGGVGRHPISRVRRLVEPGPEFRLFPQCLDMGMGPCLTRSAGGRGIGMGTTRFQAGLGGRLFALSSVDWTLATCLGDVSFRLWANNFYPASGWLAQLAGLAADHSRSDAGKSNR